MSPESSCLLSTECEAQADVDRVGGEFDLAIGLDLVQETLTENETILDIRFKSTSISKAK